VPDPIIDRTDRSNPEHEALLADSVGLALLVVLKTLTPAERLAFVLHDMFAVPFDEIAPIMERSPEATRQLASRARRRVRGADPVQIPTSPPSGRSSRRSSQRPGRVTSMRSSPSSTPTSYSEPTAVSPAYRSTSGVRRPSPARPWPFSIAAVTVKSGKIVEIDFLADPERIAQLDLAELDD
jgi:RNA polymerase sigma-70 factor, ECF subfamily